MNEETFLELLRFKKIVPDLVSQARALEAFDQATLPTRPSHRTSLPSPLLATTIPLVTMAPAPLVAAGPAAACGCLDVWERLWVASRQGVEGSRRADVASRAQLLAQKEQEQRRRGGGGGVRHAEMSFREFKQLVRSLLPSA